MRLLPLLSSATEIVHALGLGAYQVGRSHECDFPPEVLKLPVCSRPSFPVSGSSQEIDDYVKKKLQAALSIYEVDSALLRDLRPTHIITQTQCEVCAVSLGDVERALRQELKTDAEVISLEPYSLVDLWSDIQRVASRCGCEEQGSPLIAGLQRRMRDISARAHGSHSTPRVAAIEWIEPLMAAGNWVPELIELAGGKNLFGLPGHHSPWMTWEELLTADPDVIVVLPCGFDLARTRAEMHWLQKRPAWNRLQAVQSGQVIICDGNQFMNRPGPRLVESLQIFAEVLHPTLFEPSFEGIGWRRL